MIRPLAALLFLLPLALPASAASKLSGEEWSVVQIGTASVAEDAKLTLAFDAEGRISGHSGCNRFMGGFSQDGEVLSFTQIAGTMMACPQPQMDLERQMLEALSATKSFSLTPGGALELFGEDGLVLRALR